MRTTQGSSVVWIRDETAGGAGATGDLVVVVSVLEEEEDAILLLWLLLCNDDGAAEGGGRYPRLSLRVVVLGTSIEYALGV